MNESRHNGIRRGTAACLGTVFAVALLLGGVQPVRVQAMSAPAQEVEALVPVGRAVGVKLFSEGVLVVALSEDKASDAAKEGGVKVGDILLTMNGEEIDSIEQLTELVQENGESEACFTLKRGTNTLELSFAPQRGTDGNVRLGAWIRDSMAGIGTMTFYDPRTGAFAALGHAITDVDTGLVMPLSRGSIMPATIKAVKRGESGAPGELRGDFDLTTELGALNANTQCGIFGTMDSSITTEAFGEAIPLASKEEIAVGEAVIRANCAGDAVQEYTVRIEKVYSGSQPTRNLLLRVTDPKLLELTGGIVQGMSGSPIIQNGKLVGAVTHVLVDRPDYGYGILIENMLDAAD